MSQQAISPDPSSQIDLYFRVNASGVPISLTFKNSDGTAYSFVYDDFQLRIKKYVGDRKNVVLMGFGTGLTLTSNVLTISFTEENSKVTPGEYYWELYKNDYGRPWITGRAFAYEGIRPDVTEATTLTVNEGGYDLTVTISEASLVGGGTWGSITGTLSAQTDLQAALDAKQATLVSGTNIKTVNNTSLVGSGNVSINSGVWGNITGTLSDQTDLQSALNAKQASLVSGTNIKTINGNTVLGSGDLTISTSAAWGSITGTLSSQTDLQSALDAKLAKVNSDTALVDSATIDLTATKHTLASSSATRTFTISYTGDDIVMEVTLSATSATYTFPATALCVSEGTASGDNTCSLLGVSGDKYIITIKKIGSAYYVICKNFGQ